MILASLLLVNSSLNILFIFLPFFLTIQAIAAPLCLNLFNTQKASIHASDLARSLQDRITRDDIYRLRKIQNKNEQLAFSESQFNKNGIRTERLIDSKYFGLITNEGLKISTDGDHYLNHLAKKMYENFGTIIIWDPEKLGKANGAFNSKLNAIYISETMAYSAEADTTLFHEIRHAAMTYKENKNNPDLINGSAFKFFFVLWPWKKNSASPYEYFFSIQELSTWRQSAIYKLKYLNENLINKSISNKYYVSEKENLKTKTHQVYSDVLSLLNYEIELLQRNKAFLKYNEQERLISINYFNFLFLSGHKIPALYYKRHLPDHIASLDSKQLGRFFASIYGYRYQKIIAEDYLNDLKNEVITYQNELENL